MPTVYEWVRAGTLPDGHKLFRQEGTDRIAIADESGDAPHLTDDGVLWLDFSRPLVAHEQSCHIPLTNDRGNHTLVTVTDTLTLLVLADRFTWHISGKDDVRYRTVRV